MVAESITTLATTDPSSVPQPEAREAPVSPPPNACSTSPTGKRTPEHIRLKKHRIYYMLEGNIVIRVENTLFKVDLEVLHANSPVLMSIVPPIHAGKMPLVGYNDKRPLHLRDISSVDFARLLSILYPSHPNTSKKQTTVDEFVAVLKLARNLQMDNVSKTVMSQLHELPIEPIRKIAIWEEFHFDPDLLLPSYATLCQRSEPLTMAMTMSLGLRNFTKVAASRDLYRQTVGCCGCRKSLSVKESQAIAEKIIATVFAKRSPLVEKPLL
ncbi:hypothetical protein B0H34DRAFT_796162 [Crassisporium funariophilum]|nr:hypothetical protein B0H34DRAFT_796162 [Crassisporium funariophilum]